MCSGLTFRSGESTPRSELGRESNPMGVDPDDISQRLFQGNDKEGPPLERQALKLPSFARKDRYAPFHIDIQGLCLRNSDGR